MFVVSCFNIYAEPVSGSALSLDDHIAILNAGLEPIQPELLIDQSVLAAAAANTMVQIAAGPGTSNSSPLYIENVTNTRWARYEYLDDGTIDYTYINVSSFPQLAQELSYSIAATMQAFYERMWDASWDEAGQTMHQGLAYMWLNLDNIESNLNSYLPTMESYLSYLPTISTRVNTTNTRLNTINTTLSTTNSSLASIDSQLQETDNKWDWSSTFNTTSTLPRYRQNAEGGTGSDLSVNPTVRSIPNQIWYYLSTMNTSMVYAFRDMTSGVSVNNTQTYLDKDLQPISMGRTSFWRDFRNIGGNLNDIVARLGYVLASDEDIEARSLAAAQQSAAVDDFIDPDSDTSISLSDLGNIADMSSGIQDTFSSNVSPSFVFDVVNGHSSQYSIWDWFTSSTLRDLQPETLSPSKRSKSYPDTPMLDSYYNDLQAIINVYKVSDDD